FRYNFSAENKKTPHKLVSSIQKSKTSRNIFYTGFKMVLVIFYYVYLILRFFSYRLRYIYAK
ncbi:hypothetical protein ACPBJW_25525, partial [Escherichia coli]|uniref:hypothetical protein n=1 Tax=Escherichia coli TaxID=562 RepID=UPI003C25637A